MFGSSSSSSSPSSFSNEIISPRLPAAQDHIQPAKNEMQASEAQIPSAANTLYSNHPTHTESRPRVRNGIPDDEDDASNLKEVRRGSDAGSGALYRYGGGGACQESSTHTNDAIDAGETLVPSHKLGPLLDASLLRGDCTLQGGNTRTAWLNGAAVPKGVDTDVQTVQGLVDTGTYMHTSSPVCVEPAHAQLSAEIQSVKDQLRHLMSQGDDPGVYTCVFVGMGGAVRGGLRRPQTTR